MNWKDVTVFQRQQLEAVKNKKDDTELDKAVKTLAILTNRTEAQIDSLSIKDLNKQLKEIDFIAKGDAKPKAVDYIRVNGRQYRCIFDIRQLPYARYIESKFFGNDVLNNCHKIAASMVLPMKKTWRGWKVAKYDASKHEEYAQDLLEAPFESVYGSLVFFCQVFTDSIKSSKDYLISEMTKEGMNPIEAEITVMDLCNAMDGFIKLQ
jgi:hypothetical protein